MTKTIAIADAVYEKLKEIKNRVKAESYSETIMMLIENYEKFRLLRLKALSNELKMDSKEVKALKEVISRLRRRKWW